MQTVQFVELENKQTLDKHLFVLQSVEYIYIISSFKCLGVYTNLKSTAVAHDGKALDPKALHALIQPNNYKILSFSFHSYVCICLYLFLLLILLMYRDDKMRCGFQKSCVHSLCLDLVFSSVLSYGLCK